MINDLLINEEVAKEIMDEIEEKMYWNSFNYGDNDLLNCVEIYK